MTKKERILRGMFRDALLWESVKARLARNSRLDADTGCLEWTGYLTPKGYGSLGVGPNRRDMATMMAHRVAWAIANRTVPPSDRVVMHSCDNPRCINPQHLLLGTHLENNQDRHRKGRTVVPSLRGDEHPGATLTDDEALAIYHADGSQTSIAEHFGVAQATVSRIKLGHGWAHVTGHGAGRH